MRALRLVSAPPGAGKSTVSRLLASSHPLGVHLHADDFWHYVVSGFVEPRRPGSAEQNAVVMSAVAKAATEFAAGGYETFVDGVVGPWFLEPFVTHTLAADVKLDYVVLRPSEDVAVQRAGAREETALTNEEGVRGMHRQFTDLGDLERHAVDTSELSVEETVETVQKGLAEGRFTVG